MKYKSRVSGVGRITLLIMWGEFHSSCQFRNRYCWNPNAFGTYTAWNLLLTVFVCLCLSPVKLFYRPVLRLTTVCGLLLVQTTFRDPTLARRQLTTFSSGIWVDFGKIEHFNEKLKHPRRQGGRWTPQTHVKALANIRTNLETSKKHVNTETNLENTSWCSHQDVPNLIIPADCGKNQVVTGIDLRSRRHMLAHGSSQESADSYWFPSDL